MCEGMRHYRESIHSKVNEEASWGGWGGDGSYLVAATESEPLL